MRFGSGRGVKTGNWFANEMAVAEDLNFLSLETYQNQTDILALIAKNSVVTGSIEDTVLAGLTLEWSSVLTCNLRAGAAISFSGNYLTADTWGFNALAGDAFSVVVGDTQSVAFAAGSGSDRYDTLQIRPVQTLYNSKSRSFKDPVTESVTSALVNTRVEYGFEFQILQGTPGAGLAPTHTAGWIKIAEVFVPTGASSINQTNIKDVRLSRLWTSEANVTTCRKSANVEYYTPMAGYTPAFGDVVMQNADGTIRKALRGATTLFASGLGAVISAKVCALTSTTFLVVYAIGLQISAVVGTVNLTDYTITWGTPQNVKLCTTTLCEFDAVTVDSTHVLVAYYLTGGSFTQLSVVTIGISGTTVTVNTAVNGAATAMKPGLCLVPGTSNVAMVYLTSTTNLQAAIVSGGNTATPTINTPVSQALGTAAWTAVVAYSMTCFVRSDGAYVSSWWQTATLPYYWHYTNFTITGTSLAATSEGNTNHAGSFQPAPVIESPAYNVFTPITKDLSGGSATYVATMGGLSRVGIGSTGAFPNPGGWNSGNLQISQNGWMCAVDSVSGVAAFISTIGLATVTNKAASTISFVSVKGSTVSGYGSLIQPEVRVDDEYVKPQPGTGSLGNWKQGGICSLPGGNGVVVGISPLAIANETYAHVAVRRNRIVGVAIDTVGTVQHSGVLPGLSGLTMGSVYTSDENGNLLAKDANVRIGRAVSTTSMLVELQPGP